MGCLIHQFSLLYMMPWYTDITVYLCILLLMDIVGVSNFVAMVINISVNVLTHIYLLHIHVSFSVWLVMELPSHRINMPLI